MVLLLSLLASAKDCTTGKPCGETCIAVEKTCHRGATSTSGSPAMLAVPRPPAEEAAPAPAPVRYEVGSSGPGFVVLVGEKGLPYRCATDLGCTTPTAGLKVWTTPGFSVVSASRELSFHAPDGAGLTCTVTACSPVPNAATE